MKQLTILLGLFFFILSANGQTQPMNMDSLSKAHVNITLTYKNHCAIQTAMGEWGKPERISYASQVASKIDTTLSKGVDSAYWKQNITVSVPRHLFAEVFSIMGHKEEAVYGEINSNIEAQATPQIIEDSWIAPNIMQVKNARAQQRSQIINQGDKFFLSIKQ